MAGPPFLFGSFLRSALSFKCLFAKESGVCLEGSSVGRGPSWTCGPCRTPKSVTWIFFFRAILSTIIYNNYVGDRICRCASAKEWTLPTCQKNRECNTPQERFPRLWNYLGWPAAVTACHSPGILNGTIDPNMWGSRVSLRWSSLWKILHGFQDGGHCLLEIIGHLFT